jgi:hypothetical protein
VRDDTGPLGGSKRPGSAEGCFNWLYQPKGATLLLREERLVATFQNAGAPAVINGSGLEPAWTQDFPLKGASRQ